MFLKKYQHLRNLAIFIQLKNKRNIENVFREEISIKIKKLMFLDTINDSLINSATAEQSKLYIYVKVT